EFPGLTDVASGVFRAWQAHLAAALHAGGIARPRADTLAVTVIAALEGAIILSRARHDITAYDHVTRELLAATRTAMPDPASHGLEQVAGPARRACPGLSAQASADERDGWTPSPPRHPWMAGRGADQRR